MMMTFQSELARQKCDIDGLVDKASAEVETYHKAARLVHESAVLFYDEQYPMASERLKVIDRFHDDKDWAAKMIGRKTTARSHRHCSTG